MLKGNKRNGHNTPSGREEAFTLVELLLVISVIALLTSMLLPSMAKAKQSVARIHCAYNMKSITAMEHMYGSENNSYFCVTNINTGGSGPIRNLAKKDGRFFDCFGFWPWKPWSVNLSQLYLKGDGAIFICPADTRDSAPDGITYSVNGPVSYAHGNQPFKYTSGLSPLYVYTDEVAPYTTRIPNFSTVPNPSSVVMFMDSYTGNGFYGTSVNNLYGKNFVCPPETIVYSSHGNSYNFAHADGHVSNLTLSKFLVSPTRNFLAYRMEKAP